MMLNQSASQVQYYVSGRIINAAVTLTSGDWMVPCATVDLTDVHTYLDGVETDAEPEAVGSGITDLRLGSSNADSAYYNGSVAEVLLFPSKLSEAEVLDLQSYAHATYGADLGVAAPPEAP
jgi:hypothetical protein